MDDLISRKALRRKVQKVAVEAWKLKMTASVETVMNQFLDFLEQAPSAPAVPLDKLCELLAEMYHCPSSGWPSSGRACHPGCPDEAFEKLCGTDCDKHTDVERWKAFLTNWMEGLDLCTQS